MPPPPHHGHAGRGGVTVVEVRAHNQEEELARIRELAHWFPFAAVAVCHDGPPAAGAQTYPNTLEGSYEAVRDCVESATSARVALALASRDGELAMDGRVSRFHLGAGAGAGLADPLRVCAGIRAHAFAAMPRGALVTSDGAEDAAYLVRHIFGGGALPRRRDEFLRACGQCFPELYDLTVLAEWTTTAGHPPPLAAAAGSGAFRAFLALAGGAWFCEVTTAYNAFLYGLGAADNDDLVRYKKMEAEYEESIRQARELLLQVHEEAYVNNLCFL